MVAFTKGDERDPPTIPARIRSSMGLVTPEVADGINAKCGI